ncbi:hypothetical protein CC80DRAFT_570938, partial [Byssothecium circinans]
IKFKSLVSTAGIEGDVSLYQGRPTNESDKLWEELHKYGVTRIPMSEAAQLANRTTPIPGEPGQYVVILEVFQQLHCLNDTTTSPDDIPELSMKHTDHCIDSIRQSLMCSSEITPLPYAWWPKYERVLPTAGVTHTCRDFEAIRDWEK